MGPFVDEAMVGQRVRLEPLRPGHAQALWAAASESRDTYGLTTVPASEREMQDYVAFALAEADAGRMRAFATVDLRSDRVVGSTRFCSPELWRWPGPAPEPRPLGPDALEIGWTWLAAGAQRTGINTEAKLLMLTRAFEGGRVRRVTLKTDVRNQRSRDAMGRLGLHFDGVLRGHMPAADGGVRDSAYFSVLASEWPAMKARIQRLLAR